MIATAPTDAGALRYTVVYEGDPYGVKILSGELAPGRAITVSLGDALAQRDAALAERDEAREIVAKVNNSFGSYSFHTNPHPADMVEQIKWQGREEWRRANEADADLAKARDEIAGLKAALNRIVDMEPATTEVTLAHEMAQEARAALTHGGDRGEN